MNQHDPLDRILARLEGPCLGLGLSVSLNSNRGPFPTPGYAFVTTNNGANFVTTNDGANRVQVRIS